MMAGARMQGLRVTTEAYPYGAGMTAIGVPFLHPDNLGRLGIGPSNLVALMLEDTAIASDAILFTTPDGVVVEGDRPMPADAVPTRAPPARSRASCARWSGRPVPHPAGGTAALLPAARPDPGDREPGRGAQGTRAGRKRRRPGRVRPGPSGRPLDL
jgi:hypothetical protein